jgi:hypothetical protein
MTATLATAIQRDLLRIEPTRTETPKCFAYGRPFTEANAEEDER